MCTFQIRMLRCGVILVVVAYSNLAAANPVVDVAPMGAVGCYAKQDMLDLLKAGRMNGQNLLGAAAVADSALKAKVAAGKCFMVSPGESALSAPEWQDNRMDIWYGIVVFHTKSGRRFYTTAWTWRYVNDVTRFAEPP